MQNLINHFLSRFLSLFVVIVFLISCQLTPDTSENAIESNAPQFELPPSFESNLLNPLDTPHTYIEETCKYLRNKWNPINSPPGTVVMVIRFDNVNRGTADLPNSIPLIEVSDLMNQLQSQGFEAVSTKELQGFVERNSLIPPRSVYLIQTGNHGEEYFNNVFRGYWEQWGWQITNGWVSAPDLDPILVLENYEMEKEGFVDHQAQGVFEDTKLSDESAKNIIARELQGSWTGFASTYEKNPLVIIWPNGGFGFRPVEAARQLRFKMGFTQNARGPIMYNWVPLAHEVDPERPEFIPEGFIDDAIMTLPTYSAKDAIFAIDTVRIIGEEATVYAQANKEAEFEYYENVCYPEYPPIPTTP